MDSEPLVIVLSRDAAMGRRLADAARAAGLPAAAAQTAPDAVRALEHGRGPAAAWAAADADPAAVAALAAAGVAVVYADDGRACPSDLLRAGVVGLAPVAGAPDALAAALRAASERALRERARGLWAEAALRCGAAVLLLDGEGRVTGANEGFARLSGAGAEGLAGAPVARFVTVDGAQAGPAFERAVRAATPWAGDARVACGGRTVPCRAALAPVGPCPGAPGGTVLVLLDASDLVARESSLEAANERLRGQVWVDPLTRVHNRGYLQHILEREFARARRYEQPLSLVMVDVDRFKAVNDTMGHLQGDEVLRRVAEAVRGALRLGDEFARYGGDEFCAVLPQTTREEAEAVARRVREVVRSLGLGWEGAPPVGVSTGCGGTEELAPGAGPLDLVDLADRRLLGAKPPRSS